ncbi:MAG: hypothetical protein JWO67_5322 [Streptosporangiaceae bacterium]|nr:hypothetical protein [Streptosporangiaceae bacterium]
MAVVGPIKCETVVAAERLEAEICELAGHLAAATCRYLSLLADFDRRDGWSGWGIRSCAHGCPGSAASVRPPPVSRYGWHVRSKGCR